MATHLPQSTVEQTLALVASQTDNRKDLRLIHFSLVSTLIQPSPLHSVLNFIGHESIGPLNYPVWLLDFFCKCNLCSMITVMSYRWERCCCSHLTNQCQLGQSEGQMELRKEPPFRSTVQTAAQVRRAETGSCFHTCSSFCNTAHFQPPPPTPCILFPSKPLILHI